MKEKKRPNLTLSWRLGDREKIDPSFVYFFGDMQVFSAFWSIFFFCDSLSKRNVTEKTTL